MIRVERGPAPTFVHDPGFQAARARYEEFWAGGGSRASQTTLDLQVAMGEYLPQVSEHAHRLFNGKCAYTEVPVEPRLYLHRPESDTEDERSRLPQHYWWTAFWYRNWYVASKEVEALKRNYFPVVGRRANVPSPRAIQDSDIAPDFLDRGVLLDPCEDEPLLHLRFDLEGTVRAWSPQESPWLAGDERRRGDETIRLLDLNSRQLQGSRSSAIALALGQLDKGFPTFWRALAPTLPHSGAVRQAVALRLLDMDLFAEAKSVLLPELAIWIATNPASVSAAQGEEVRASLRESHPELAALLADHPIDVREELPEDALPTPPTEVGTRGPAAVIPRTAALTSIVIENVQAIDRYELAIPAAVEPGQPNDPARPALAVTGVPTSSETQRVGLTGRPWRVFLGENGTGKSSVLRAIALALAGDQVEQLVADAGVSWKDLVRRGTPESRVQLQFTGDLSVDLRFTEHGVDPVSRQHLPRMEGFVRGFGATRVSGDAAPNPARTVRLGNLFNPLQPVVDAQQWLVELAGRKARGDFNVAAVAIARLLDREDRIVEGADPTGARFIEAKGDEIHVDGEPLRTLSDGYQAIISLACDLMAGAGSGLSDMRNARGIVLVDELGCYLHPRWKMRITRTLRDVFPSMQFLVTTHEPLCLRGLTEMEVVRVTRSPTDADHRWHAEFETIEGSPSKYRVDQLLTSPYFGLDSTIDPDVEQQFFQYYKLLREPDPTNEEQRRRLRATLSQHGILGYTARDQLIYDAIDEFLAKSPQMDPESRRRQRQETLSYVVNVWRDVAARREVGTRSGEVGPP